MFTKLKAAFKRWYEQRYVEQFTVACDISLFAYPMNLREQLFHFNGLAKARRFAHNWVRIHPSGQARILKGYITWESDDAKRASTKVSESAQ